MINNSGSYDSPSRALYMPDVVAGWPDGMSFGEVLIRDPQDPEFGKVTDFGLYIGFKALPIFLFNTSPDPITLSDPPSNIPRPSNPWSTNTSLRIEGFEVGDRIESMAVAEGRVVFQPEYRGAHIGTIRFFTDPPFDLHVSGVGGVGIVNAVAARSPVQLSFPAAYLDEQSITSFPLVNRGDRPLVIKWPSQVSVDNSFFELASPLPIIVPPEFKGGDVGVPVQLAFRPRAVGLHTGHMTFDFTPTEIGRVERRTLTVVGQGIAPNA